MSASRYTPRPGFIEIRDTRTAKVVCHYNPRTSEVEVVQRGDVRRGTLPIQDAERVAQYAQIAEDAS